MLNIFNRRYSDRFLRDVQKMNDIKNKEKVELFTSLTTILHTKKDDQKSGNHLLDSYDKQDNKITDLLGYKNKHFTISEERRLKIIEDRIKFTLQWITKSLNTNSNDSNIHTLNRLNDKNDRKNLKDEINRKSPKDIILNSIDSVKNTQTAIDFGKKIIDLLSAKKINHFDDDTNKEIIDSIISSILIAEYKKDSYFKGLILNLLKEKSIFLKYLIQNPIFIENVLSLIEFDDFYLFLSNDCLELINEQNINFFINQGNNLLDYLNNKVVLEIYDSEKMNGLLLNINELDNKLKENNKELKILKYFKEDIGKYLIKNDEIFCKFKDKISIIDFQHYFLSNHLQLLNEDNADFFVVQGNKLLEHLNNSMTPLQEYYSFENIENISLQLKSLDENLKRYHKNLNLINNIDNDNIEELFGVNPRESKKEFFEKFQINSSNFKENFLDKYLKQIDCVSRKFIVRLESEENIKEFIFRGVVKEKTNNTQNENSNHDVDIQTIESELKFISNNKKFKLVYDKNNIPLLPAEIYSIILSYLDVDSYVNLGKTCQSMNSIVFFQNINMKIKAILLQEEKSEKEYLFIFYSVKKGLLNDKNLIFDYQVLFINKIIDEEVKNNKICQICYEIYLNPDLDQEIISKLENAACEARWKKRMEDLRVDLNINFQPLIINTQQILTQFINGLENPN